jgi:arylsulfatase A-like enzyme
MKTIFASAAGILLGLLHPVSAQQAPPGDPRPNIVFAIADDWGWPHASIYGNDDVCQTPTFDGVARDGILFHHAYISSPSCTPSRNAILTGQYHWRLGQGGNLWSVLDTRHRTYPHLLEDSGYFVGSWRKSWGPGDASNWERYPAGERFQNPGAFLAAWKQTGKPFCFWFGASDPHRTYKLHSGRDSGMNLSRIKLFEHYPDSEAIRGDVADYYYEVQRFDRELGQFLETLKREGVLDNTLVVVTGDHGMPFPRCKSNLYDSGARVPLAIQWPKAIKPGRVIEDFVSTTDLAPTFLEAAGLAPLPAMTGRSLMPILRASGSGRLEPEERSHVFTGKERHTQAQEAPDAGGTPMRAIRNHEFLLIRNYRTDRWPAGTPHWENASVPGSWLADCDNGPTKTYIVENRDKDTEHRLKHGLCFGKRPGLELYDLRKDPGQLTNVAASAAYRDIAAKLEAKLTAKLEATGDPRVLGKGEETFDRPKYLGGTPKHPDYKAPPKRKKAPN